MLLVQILGDSIIKKFFVIFCIFLNTLSAFAMDSPYSSQEFQEVLKHDTYEPNYFTLIFGLIIVICLIYFTGYFYQKLIGVNSKINKKAGIDNNFDKVKIISSTPLGQGKCIYIVEIRGKHLVLGATDNQINLLKEYDTFDIKKETD